MNKNYEVAEIKNTINIFEVMPADNSKCEKVRFSTTTDTKRLFNALNSPSEKLKNYIGETLSVVDIIITTAEVHENKDDNTSPMVHRPCIHFFTELGEHISTLSNGICRSVQSIMEVGLTPTESSPLQFKVITGESKKGVFHSIELL